MELITAKEARELSGIPRDSDEKILGIIMKLIKRVSEKTDISNNYFFRIEQWKTNCEQQDLEELENNGSLEDLCVHEKELVRQIPYERFFNERVRKKLLELGYTIAWRSVYVDSTIGGGSFPSRTTISWE